MAVTCLITCILWLGFELCPHVAGARSFWLQVPTGRCSSLWLYLDCSVCHQTGRSSPQLVLASASCVLCLHLLYQTGRCSPQLEMGLCGKPPWLPLFLMMGYKESVSVRLILDLILMIWSRVLIPCPWKSMRDLWDMGRMKRGSLQILLSHHLPSGSPMHSGVKRSWMNPCQEMGKGENASIPFHVLWLVILQHASRLILP